MPLDQLWATWRSMYVTGAAESRSELPGDLPPGAPDDGRSLFERILDSGAPDDETFIVERGANCFVILNRFPYTSGHLMVLPNRAVPDLEDLDDAEFTELWDLVRTGVVALKSTLRCDGVNVGINLGRPAGGSQADHLHVHCVPRWVGDANFMAVVGGSQVMPVALPDDLDPASGALAHRRYAADMTEQPEDPAPDEVQVDAVDPIEDEYVDELPEDLDLAEFVGPHTFPNNNRRRIPAALYLLFGAACVALWVTKDDTSALVNAGTLWAGVGLVAFGLYGMVAGWTLRVEESDALVTASTQVGFPVGHAAAQMVWRGWLSRPTWRILLYSDENPPTRARHRAGRRRRRRGARVVRRGQPRGLGRLRPRRRGRHQHAVLSGSRRTAPSPSARGCCTPVARSCRVLTTVSTRGARCSTDVYAVRSTRR